ncbi:MAG: hypothetical protein RLZ11_421 [Bacteroidota bacterium]
MSSPDQQPIFFADILIPAALPTTYTWSIPSTLVDQVKVGCRVEVNLGKRKRYAGLVNRVYSSKTESRLVKPILQVLDTKPIIFSQQLKFWEWISNYYVCTQGEVMAAALPANFRLTSDTELIWNEDASDDFSHLSTDEYLVAEALFLRKKLQISEVQLVLNRQHIYPVIEKLLSQRVCLIQESLVERYKPRKENYLSFSSPYSNDSNLEALVNNWKGSERQLNLILHFLDISKGDRAISAQQLIKSSGENISVVKALVNKGILVVQDRQVNRIEELSPFVSIDFTLSTAQRQAYKEIESVFERKDVCLLHGVTSSGKTNIYIELIASAIQKGKQVLYLLPEIALTSQIIRRLQQHFGGYVGVYHSKFSANERVEIWNRVLAGEYKIILGARSAIFLPFTSLGLVICDEEHESSYKQQDPAPRYNGRDAAVYLATLFKAKVLLGSATPSLETYKHAIDDKYGLVTLTERFGAVSVPLVELVNRKNVASQKKEIQILTAPLQEAIQKALDESRQVILFQNRRGYSPYQVCVQCGWVPRCLHCDISLTYHKREKQLLCHYCGSRYSTLFRCGSCGKEKFAQKNFGTELVEEILADLFPAARIGRMDIDTIRGKNAHDKLVQTFERGEIDILIGTQMVVKGLDVAKVDVVGVLDADGLLQFADFRVHERAFQLIEQVSGRAGRRQKKGKVIVQTYNPQQPLFGFLINHDYLSFFKEELSQRETFFYPPFSKLIVLSVRHMDELVSRGASHALVELLNKQYREYIVGPAPSIVFRVRNQYRMEILLKLPRKASLVEQCKEDIKSAVLSLRKLKKFSKVAVVIDVDPN